MHRLTESFRKIALLRTRYRGIQGGQGAGKTIAILQLLINQARLKPSTEIIVVSDELTKMRLTVIKDFVKIMVSLGVFEQSQFVAGTLYNFPNGSYIKFFGLDKEDIGKGLRSDFVFVNEANKCGFEAVRQLISRTKFVYFDFNPDRLFWYHHEIMIDPECSHVTLTYRDNKYLPDAERQVIESYYRKGYNPDGTIRSRYWANKARVYGDGEVGMVDGLIFENWSLYDDYPPGEHHRLYGVDWGSVDPTVLVECRFYPDRQVYLKQHFYSPIKDNEPLIRLCRTLLTDNDLIIADNAKPDHIRDMILNGINCIPCDKRNLSTNGSIMDGIDIMQNYHYHIHRDDKELINEFNSYAYKRCKFTGQTLPIPVDVQNHGIDAIRYVSRAYHLYGY